MMQEIEKNFTLGKFAPADEAQWDKLWHGYMGTYYLPALRPSVMQATWKAILADSGSLHAIALRDCNGQVQGFAHYITHFSTKFGCDEAYLMDLYVDQDVQNNGFGHKLMDAVISECRQAGLARLSLITKPGVSRNEYFYSKYTSKQNWDRYILILQAENSQETLK